MGIDTVEDFRGIDNEDGDWVIDLVVLSVLPLRGVKGGVPLYFKGHVVGSIGVSGAHQDVDKVIAVKGLEAVKGLKDSK